MSIEIQPAFRTIKTKHEDEHHRTLVFRSDDGWLWPVVAPLWAVEQIERLVKLAQSVVHLSVHGTSQEQWALRGLADDARAALGETTPAHECGVLCEVHGDPRLTNIAPRERQA